MIELTIKLLIAHIIGDFVLQPDKWVEDKTNRNIRSPYLYLHGLVHFASLLILLEFNWSYWLSILIVVTSHLIIDALKGLMKGEIDARYLFISDQLLHLAVIALVVYFSFPYSVNFEMIYSVEILLFILAILMLSIVSSIVMKSILSAWSLEEGDPEDSLAGAGSYIGILERLFVFGFIILNQWSAIGLLIAAKSVFRFSDLTRAKDRKLTEYILIGTLISFGISISIGLLYLHLGKQI